MDEKQEVRYAFHSVLNYLNKISVKTSTVSEMIRMHDVAEMREPELRENLQTALCKLDEAADNAVKTGEELFRVKSMVYRLLGIDAGRPPAAGMSK